MPVTCDSWPSTSATYSCRARSERLCRAARRMTLTLEEVGEPPDAVVERDRRREPEAIAHRAIDGVELDVFLGLALMADADVDAEYAGHRCNDVIDADRRARREVDGRARAPGPDEPQHALDRVVDVHEVDEVPTVAAQHELALAVGQRQQPPRRDLPRRFVRPVGAEKADVDVAAQRAAAFHEESDVVLGRQFRNRVWQPG